MLRNAFFSLLTIPIAALAADPSLLNLAMPDAKVMAGLQVDATKNSVFGQYVLAHMQPDDPSFQKFMADAGFDPRRDITEVVISSNWEHNTPGSRWLVVARGVFNPARIAGSAQAKGGTIANYQGVDILSPATDNAIAFLDSTIAVMGDAASVKAAIQRKHGNASANSSLLSKVHRVSLKNDFWFVTLVPISEFSSVMPDPNLQGAMKGDLMQSISQASGGIKFGPAVLIAGEALTRSNQDAQALQEVVRFIAGLIQQNRQNSVLLDTLDLKTTGNVMSMSLTIPETQLERMIESARTAPAK